MRCGSTFAVHRFTNPMYVSELEAKLEAAERRITELDAAPKTANFPEPAAAADGASPAQAGRFY